MLSVAYSQPIGKRELMQAESKIKDFHFQTLISLPPLYFKANNVKAKHSHCALFTWKQNGSRSQNAIKNRSRCQAAEEAFVAFVGQMNEERKPVLLDNLNENMQAKP